MHRLCLAACAGPQSGDTYQSGARYDRSVGFNAHVSDGQDGLRTLRVGAPN